MNVKEGFWNVLCTDHIRSLFPRVLRISKVLNLDRTSSCLQQVTPREAVQTYPKSISFEFEVCLICVICIVIWLCISLLMMMMMMMMMNTLWFNISWHALIRSPSSGSHGFTCKASHCFERAPTSRLDPSRLSTRLEAQNLWSNLACKKPLNHC